MTTLTPTDADTIIAARSIAPTVSEGRIYAGSSTVQFGATAPTEGIHSVGDVCFSTAVTRAGATANKGWICITAGTPGTWKTFDQDSVYDVRNYGAVGDGVTDDTAAINAAVAAAIVEAGVNWDTDASGWPIVYLPRGDYLISDTIAVGDRDNLLIRGDGIASTRIRAAGATSFPMIEFGSFSATPATFYPNNNMGAIVEGLCFYDTVHGGSWKTANPTVDRYVTGIQDNGSGVVVRDCRFHGLRCGVFVPYGGDLARYSGLKASSCDIGYYFGPKSQQMSLRDIEATECEYGAVFQWASHVVADDCSFIFNRTADVVLDWSMPCWTIDRGGAPLNQVVATSGGTIFEMNGTWWETGTAGFAPLQHVLITADAEIQGLIRLTNNLLMSGAGGMGTPAGTEAMVHVDAPCNLEVDGVMYYPYWNTSPSAAASGWTKQIVYVDSCTPNVKVSNLTRAGDATNDWLDTASVPAFNTAQDGLSQNRVEWRSAAPTSGWWHIGDVVYRTDPAASASPMGWVCITTGLATAASTGDVTSGSLSIANVTDAETVWRLGAPISGTHIPADSWVKTLSGTTLTFDNATSTGATGTAAGEALTSAAFKTFGSIDA